MYARSWALGLLLVSCSACMSSPASPSDPMYRFNDNWIMGDDPERTVTCIPHGETLTLRGTIVHRAFRKNTGAVLRVSAQDEWILTYRAEGVLLELDGKRVEVTGRACEKQYEAAFGQHFDLATLVVLTGG